MKTLWKWIASKFRKPPEYVHPTRQAKCDMDFVRFAVKQKSEKDIATENRFMEIRPLKFKQRLRKEGDTT